MLSFGQATVLPTASPMNSISEFGLHTRAPSNSETSTQTFVALGPKGTKCTFSAGSVENTRPKATLCPKL